MTCYDAHSCSCCQQNGQPSTLQQQTSMTHDRGDKNPQHFQAPRGTTQQPPPATNPTPPASPSNNNRSDWLDLVPPPSAMQALAHNGGGGAIGPQPQVRRMQGNDAHDLTAAASNCSRGGARRTINDKVRMTDGVPVRSTIPERVCIPSQPPGTRTCRKPVPSTKSKGFDGCGYG
jgi:hypothetical protein